MLGTSIHLKDNLEHSFTHDVAQYYHIIFERQISDTVPRAGPRIRRARLEVQDVLRLLLHQSGLQKGKK